MRIQVKFFAITVGMGCLLGCSAAYNALPALDPRSPKQKTADRASKCDGGGSRKWDLGTGSLEDIADNEPKFYVYEANQGIHKNKSRVTRLKNSSLPDGLTLKVRTISGHQLAEFEGPPSPPERVVLFSKENKGMGILLSPASCPHVVIYEQCINDQIETDVTIKGSLPCFKGISGSLKIDGPGIPHGTKINPGKVLWSKSSSGGAFITLDWRTQRVFSGAVAADTFPKATPALLTLLLEEADDTTAFKAFQQLDPQWTSPTLAKEVKRKRVVRLRKRLSSEDLLKITRTTSFDPSFPGSAKMRQMVNQKLVGDFEKLTQAAPTEVGYWRGIVLIENGRSVDVMDVSGFVKKYGAYLSGGHFGGEPYEAKRAEDEFLKRWPQSKWAQAMLGAREKQATEARKVAEAARQEQEAEYRREAAAEKSKCSSRCQFKCMSGRYVDKVMCRRGCVDYECGGDQCEGACRVECSRGSKAGQPGCVSACRAGRCGK